MRRQIAALATVGMFALVTLTMAGWAALATASVAGDGPEWDREAQTVWENFINHDCEVGEEGVALAAVLERKELFEPRLIEVLRDGPGEEELELARLEAEGQWQILERYLNSRKVTGLSLSSETALRSLKQETFVEREVAVFILKQRENAAIALAAIGTPRSMQALRAVALTDENLRVVIVGAVEAQRRKVLN